MGKRGRMMAMAAAGFATAAAPFVLGQQAAGAAETTATDQGSLQFVTFSGATVQCNASLTAIHDTDNPNQPELRWGMELEGAGCFDGLTTRTTATYKDEGGTTRSSQALTFELSSGFVQGAYTDTSVTTVFGFDNCDPQRSGACSITLTASPK
jgi:hypothetical protein